MEKKAERDTLNIKNRVKNMMWTVSGDYSLSTEIDVSAFRKSKYISLYDAVREGCFAKYFDQAAFDRYVERKILFGAPAPVLEPLIRLCKDSAVWKKAAEERPGIPDIRRRAFEDTLEKDMLRLTHTPWNYLEACYMNYALGRPEKDDRLQTYLSLIQSLSDAADTGTVIHCLDTLYEKLYTNGFEKEFNGLRSILKASEKDGDKIAGEEEDESKKEQIVDLMYDELEEEDDGKNEKLPSKAVILEDESMNRMEGYVAQNYGKSYLSLQEQRLLSAHICKGAHDSRHLHFTDGILQNRKSHFNDLHSDALRHGTPAASASEDPTASEYCSAPEEFAAKIREENLLVYSKNHLITRQNILTLAGILRRALLSRSEREIFDSEYGQINVNKLWNLGRTSNKRLFEREFIQESTNFVVDILIDASGSQQKRQSTVALQGYILSCALSMISLPHRVMGFCTFGDYTVMRRFRDYDESPEADERIFEFYGSANNRDGLAIRAAANGLEHRHEEHKILIILSDGTPNDIIVSKSKSLGFQPYCEEYAANDTAGEIRKLRNQGISVLGVFTGEEEALKTEQTIFGREFAYIRNINTFSNVVGRYLERQFTG